MFFYPDFTMKNTHNKCKKILVLENDTILSVLLVLLSMHKPVLKINQFNKHFFQRDQQEKSLKQSLQFWIKLHLKHKSRSNAWKWDFPFRLELNAFGKFYLSWKTSEKVPMVRKLRVIFSKGIKISPDEKVWSLNLHYLVETIKGHKLHGND